MLLWADGFEHYGTSTTKMLDGVYATAGGALNTTYAQSGTTSYFVSTTSYNGDLSKSLRKVLPAAETKVGAMGHFYFAGLPITGTVCQIFSFMANDGVSSQVAAVVDANGAIRFTRGVVTAPSANQAGTLITTSTPVITSNAWNHVEIQIYSHATLGWVRVSVNGIHRFEATALNTAFDGTGCASILQQNFSISNSDSIAGFYVDNLLYYNFTGTAAIETDFCCTVDGTGKATNYIGELQCMYLPPNGNTAQDTWAKSTGTSAFAVISETTPNDADYIFASTLNDLTEVALADLPTQITYVRGVMVLGRMAKSDAGAAQTQFGLKSAAAITDATSRPITTVPTYWWDFINVDPNTSVRWTRASLNAALLRLKRSL